jgi:exodeoxyribonuclease V gamma subunit
MIELELNEADGMTLQTVERAAGRLPHGSVGAALIEEMQQCAARAAGQVQAAGLSLQRESEQIDLRVGDFRILGRLARAQEDGLAGISFNALPAGDQLGIWIDHLLAQLAAATADGVRTRWLAAGELLELRPVADADAQLESLLDLYWQGLSSPLHLFPRSSMEYVRQRRAGRDSATSLARAWGKWAGGYMIRAEWDNPYYRIAFPDGDVLDDAFMQLGDRVFGPYLEALEAQ